MEPRRTGARRASLREREIVDMLRLNGGSSRIQTVNGGVKTSHVAGQKSTTSGYLERAMETG